MVSRLDDTGRVFGTPRRGLFDNYMYPVVVCPSRLIVSPAAASVAILLSSGCAPPVVVLPSCVRPKRLPGISPPQCWLGCDDTPFVGLFAGPPHGPPLRLLAPWGERFKHPLAGARFSPGEWTPGFLKNTVPKLGPSITDSQSKGEIFPLCGQKPRVTPIVFLKGKAQSFVRDTP